MEYKSGDRVLLTDRGGVFIVKEKWGALIAESFLLGRESDGKLVVAHPEYMRALPLLGLMFLNLSGEDV